MAILPVLFCLWSAGACLPAMYPMMVVAAQQEEHHASGVRFTRPDGTVIYVNPRVIAFVRGPLPGEHGGSTIVFSSGAKQAVEETVDEVIEAIHADMPEPGER